MNLNICFYPELKNFVNMFTCIIIFFFDLTGRFFGQRRR